MATPTASRSRLLLADLGYIPLRLLRRYLFRGSVLQRCGRFLPFYEPGLGDTAPDTIADRYEQALAPAGCRLAGLDVLEAGSGPSAATGYCLAARGAARVVCFDPLAPFDARRDALALAAAARRHGQDAAALRARVERTARMEDLAPASFDLALSHSVLEHVREPATFLRALLRILKPAGLMVHIVDYRDHFFRFPYHFLRFRRRTWDRFLDPGDLPRWRLSDHLRVARSLGLEARTLAEQSDPAGFARIAPWISPDFDRGDRTLAVTQATLLLQRAAA